MPLNKNKHNEKGYVFCSVDYFDCARLEYNLAIEEIETSLKNDSSDCKKYYELGLIYEILQQDMDAIENYKLSIELNQKYPEVASKIGYMLFRSKNYKLGFSIFGELIEQYPNNRTYSHYRGLFLKEIISKMNLNQPEILENAIVLVEEYDNFIAINIDEKYTSYTMIYLYAAIERYDQCFEYIDRQKQKDGFLELFYFEQLGEELKKYFSIKKKENFINQFKNTFSFIHEIFGLISECDSNFDPYEMYKKIPKNECNCVSHDDVDFRTIYLEREKKLLKTNIKENQP